MRLIKILFVGVLLPFGHRSYAQSEFTLQDFHPASPTAFQFLKYDELPVSEYTGIPNISVPLYTISVDGITIPLELSYHAGGIRVSEDAGWVGLGWDLQVGSIVQEVHNLDDYTAPTLLQPDYQNTSSLPPQWLPFLCDWYNNILACNLPGPGYTNPYPIYSGPTNYAYAVATNYYMPINGNFYDQYDGQNISEEGSSITYDSDPDIFKASFLGHSIKFILNFKNKQIVVLNKPGYTVTRSGNTYEIVDPEGEQFYFGQYAADSLSYSTSQLNSNGFNNTSLPLVSTKTWMLTKIITKHQRQIVFNYAQTGYSDLYPSFSERWDSAITTGISAVLVAGNNPFNVWGQGQGYASGITQTFNYSKENRLYLQSITWPSGTVTFNTSARSDVIGGLRLDSLKVQNQQQTVVKAWYFNYNYLNSGAVGGNAFTPNLSNIVTEFGNMPDLRLNLQSLSDNSGATYNFTYNPLLLPAKNSIAQDLWGFYNGQLNNISFIPDPGRYKSSPTGVINPLVNNTLVSNGNNISASAYCSQASSLIKIQYPTGGVDSFEYEPNQFSNYWTPDSANSSNTITSGDGIRIHAVDYYASPGLLAKRIVYSYSGGLGIVPLVIYRNFTPTSYQLIGSSECQTTNYNVFELSAKGFYSTNALGSVNGVGYSEVTTQEIDNNGITNGSEQTYFANIADNVNNSGVSSSLVAAELPATKNTANPENGLVDSVLYFTNSGALIKKITNSYTNNVSPYFYGVKVFGYGGYIWQPDFSQCTGSGNCSWQVLPQTLLAFYPIYDFESLLSSRTTIEYGGGDSLMTGEGFGYDQYDQLSSHTKSTPAYYILDHTEYTGTVLSYYTDAASQQLLFNAHRYDDILMSQRSQGPLPYQNEPVSSYYKHYEAVNNIPMESYVTINKNLISPTPLTDTVTYDSYDPTFINLQQVTNQKMRSCILWDYNGVYPIAEVKNATIGNVAYTSFEADGSGNWKISSTNRDSSSFITGKKCYNLSYGSISDSNLNSGTTYIVSYWSRTGANYSVRGTTAMLQGKTITINGAQWTYFEHTVTGVSSTTVSGGGGIDELRLYPKGSLMKTYTYNPLLGLSTECDEDNRATYYFYDWAGRLAYIKDQDGNILKTFQYHYQNQ